MFVRLLMACACLRAVFVVPASALAPSATRCTVSDADISEGLPSGSSFAPKVRPEVFAAALSQSITIDGVLNEPAWAGATRVTGFTEIQPGDQERDAVRRSVHTGGEE